jgi:hypothetical protein
LRDILAITVNQAQTLTSIIENLNAYRNALSQSLENVGSYNDYVGHSSKTTLDIMVICFNNHIKLFQYLIGPLEKIHLLIDSSFNGTLPNRDLLIFLLDKLTLGKGLNDIQRNPTVYIKRLHELTLGSEFTSKIEELEKHYRRNIYMKETLTVIAFIVAIILTFALANITSGFSLYAIVPIFICAAFINSNPWHRVDKSNLLDLRNISFFISPDYKEDSTQENRSIVQQRFFNTNLNDTNETLFDKVCSNYKTPFLAT